VQTSPFLFSPYRRCDLVSWTSDTMLLLKTLSAVAAVASSAAALNVPKSTPVGWAVDDSTPINKETSTMKLRVQLTPQNMGKFHELAIDVRPLLQLFGLATNLHRRLPLLATPPTGSTSLSTSLMP
jgi:hypothetical protein